ncbi:hypothetical protein M413DRAFT_26099 [Hebeloma cylindrosporum]|uniref:Uncharacterized protein n=1 Tax=Hebeloma cylindrosporum TaxID=76867 RepID=A0A0C3CI32_HEBCY|nr:hypothetical protein M413DRAFT_26099 [Hebeloma cylindrosporum h7]
MPPHQDPDLDVVKKFLSDLENLPPGNESYYKVEELIAPALEGEKDLRMAYAATNGPRPSDPHIGLIDIFSISPTPVVIGRHRGGAHLNAAHIFPFRHFDHPHRLLDGQPAVVPMGRFKENWDIFSCGLLKKLNWGNIIAAGGAVLACLKETVPDDMNKMERMDLFQSYEYAGSDIDLFLYDLCPEEAKIKMQSIEKQIKESAVFPTVCVRKTNTISIHTAFPAHPIQIILRLYHSPAEVLAGFDVDSACCAYDGTRVWMNPCSLAACVRQANTIDITRRSPSYEVRLAKYSLRGFEVYFPSLRRDDIPPDSPVLRKTRTNFPPGLARLLVLEEMRSNYESFPNLEYPGARTSMGIKNAVPEPPSLVEVEDETVLTISRVLEALNIIPFDDGEPVDIIGLSHYNFSWRELPYGEF